MRPVCFLDAMTTSIYEMDLAEFERLSLLIWKIDLRIEPVLLELNNDISGFLNEIQTNGIQIYQS